jgi:hypothetical protein
MENKYIPTPHEVRWWARLGGEIVVGGWVWFAVNELAHWGLSVAGWLAGLAVMALAWSGAAWLRAAKSQAGRWTVVGEVAVNAAGLALVGSSARHGPSVG